MNEDDGLILFMGYGFGGFIFMSGIFIMAIEGVFVGIIVSLFSLGFLFIFSYLNKWKEEYARLMEEKTK